MKRYILATLLGFITASHADDWSRFRGPNGSGIATGAKPPTSWSDSQNLKWKAAIPGLGTSSPILVGNKIFVTCWSGYADGKNNEPTKLKRHLVCVDRISGKILWKSDIAAESNVDFYDGFLATRVIRR